VQRERDDGAASARQQAARQIVVRMTVQFRIVDACDGRMGGQRGRDQARAGHVAVHAQAQRFQALQHDPGRVRAEGGAEVAQAGFARAQGEGADRRFLGKYAAVEARIRLAQVGMAARARVGRVPVERAAVDQQSARRAGGAGQETGVVHDEVGAMVERPQQAGRGQRGVHEQGQVVRVRDGGHGRDIEYAMGEDGADQQPRFRTDSGLPGGGVARVDEGRRDAAAAQAVGEQGVRIGTERVHGDDVVAGAGQRGHRQVQGGLPAGRGDAGHAAFEGGGAFFQPRDGRIGGVRGRDVQRKRR
jgi:hypothetical protein